MQSIDLATARQLMCFGSGVHQALGERQIDATVALHNILARTEVAYLADEVGMGKTYIALGIVALMRRMKPSLRVLYLLPKNNVRDKWGKDSRNFIQDNYLQQDLVVKGIDGQPAGAQVACHSLYELIHASATDKARDFFICNSAFSFRMGNTVAELASSLDEFGNMLPQEREAVGELGARIARLANMDPEAADSKRKLEKCKYELKVLWARGINRILPRFDLVVVDEAHNFRHAPESSDRNRLVAEVLGTAEGQGSRVGRLLLLSATPYDRDVAHLSRQLALFGKGQTLLPDGRAASDVVHRALAAFMVRRLNEIYIDGKPHTRNMYRVEHRSGKRAEIELKPEQQLFCALLQKKLSDHLRQDLGGKFELGMLASFESYHPGTKAAPDQFDGQDPAPGQGMGQSAEIRDRSIIEELVRSYQDVFGRAQLPPHPKMDAVAAETHQLAFEEDKKRLVFVRRIFSVKELRAKLELRYNCWLGDYVATDEAVHVCWRKYVESREADGVDQDLADVSNDTFFGWFYRGENKALQGQQDALGTLPHNYRAMLGQETMLFELNWCLLPGMPAPSTLTIDWKLARRVPTVTRQKRFNSAQYLYLKALAVSPDHAQARLAGDILTAAFADFEPECDLVDASGMTVDLEAYSLWDFLREQPQLSLLSPLCDVTADSLAEESAAEAERRLRRVLIHQRLVAVVCRLDHPFIDLYALRDRRGSRDRAGLPGVSGVDGRLGRAFTNCLLNQALGSGGFSSFGILRNIGANLDVLVKLNFDEAYRGAASGLNAYLSGRLHPLDPIAGATGDDSSNRSAKARRFRMPGYPRVLVSTDVFQEGEDLHTFCDEVVHYGIAASPIALEQKVGRVDRVGSLAQRNLAQTQGDSRSHFIQVFFPHIRESLELLQVRHAARNLNEFLRSLHRIDANATRYEGVIDLEAQLQDDGAVPGQITDYLKTPFGVRPDDLVGGNAEPMLEQDARELAQRLDELRPLLERHFALQGESRARMNNWYWKLNDFELRLRNTTGQRELMLSITQTERIAIDIEPGIDFLQRLQSDHRIRHCLGGLAEPASDAGEPEEGGTVGDSVTMVTRNVQLWLAGHRAPDEQAMQGALARFAGTQPALLPVNETQASLLRQAAALGGVTRLTWVKHNRLQVDFEAADMRQEVMIYHAGDLFVLSSVALDAQELAAYAERWHFLQTLTLQRNAYVDLVDCYIDQNRALAVRAVHPATGVDPSTIAFLAKQVAAEASRLRYICNRSDSDQAEEERNEEEQEAVADGGTDTGRYARGHIDDEQKAMRIIREILEQASLPRLRLLSIFLRQFGFGRRGSQIEQVAEKHLRTAQRRGIVTVNGRWLQLGHARITDYPRELFKEQFLVMLWNHRKEGIERHKAPQLFARWFGFSRTGHVIRAEVEALVGKLRKEKSLRIDGGRLFRE